MPRTVLVLAASVYQLDAIRTARRLGLRVVTVDNRPSNPGHALADAHANVDTTDFGGVLEVARRERIDGIISPCTDVAVPTAAYVAAELGLRGVPLEATRVTCSKARFRDFLASTGFSCPRAIPVDDAFIPPDGLFDRRWVLKPNRSSGSKGIRVVDSAESLSTVLRESLAFDPDRSGVLEEFIEGHQGTCEGFLLDGRVVFSLLLDRETAQPPFVATHGHRVPANLSTGDARRVVDAIASALSELGIASGPFDCDFILRQDDVVLLEMSPRLGGNSIAPLLRFATGVDLTEAALRHAVGETPAFPRSVAIRPAGLALLGVSGTGRLAYDSSALTRLREQPWVRHLTIDFEPGAPVEPFVDGRKRVGEGLVAGDSRAEVDARLDQVRRELDVRAEAPDG
ncbi:MAG: ATP-grasp domain-containing protein [Acidobacteria bacterium]|nr:ATP-grasp domain-containing protein [Acidobacteriota bacterium]